MATYQQYQEYRKPSWAPPAWLFGPVWTVLYVGIAVSFATVAYGYFNSTLPFSVALPFALNLITNLIFTPIQFGLRSFVLAALDILCVLTTLVWALLAVYPFIPWVAYINIPYLAWVSFATVLQLTVTALNRHAKVVS
jgi:tryptophan-rich sensory protein